MNEKKHNFKSYRDNKRRKIIGFSNPTKQVNTEGEWDVIPQKPLHGTFDFKKND